MLSLAGWLVTLLSPTVEANIDWRANPKITELLRTFGNFRDRCCCVFQMGCCYMCSFWGFRQRQHTN